MAAARVMTVRIDELLLKQVRDAASREQRSLSGEVLFLVRQGLGPRPGRSRRLPTMGWLRDRDVPETLQDFKRLRRSLSSRLDERLRSWPRAR